MGRASLCPYEEHDPMHTVCRDPTRLQQLTTPPFTYPLPDVVIALSSDRSMLGKTADRPKRAPIACLARPASERHRKPRTFEQRQSARMTALCQLNVAWSRISRATSSEDTS